MPPTEFWLSIRSSEAAPFQELHHPKAHSGSRFAHKLDSVVSKLSTQAHAWAHILLVSNPKKTHVTPAINRYRGGMPIPRLVFASRCH